MLSGETNARMSREMETRMDFLQTQISRAINSAISERIIPEIQSMIENSPLAPYGIGPRSSLNEDSVGNVWKNTKLTLIILSQKNFNRGPSVLILLETMIAKLRGLE